eukprot:1184060-Prorocentrum_minimum.AAC.2
MVVRDVVESGRSMTDGFIYTDGCSACPSGRCARFGVKWSTMRIRQRPRNVVGCIHQIVSL